MSTPLFGVETEYSISADPGAHAASPYQLAEVLLTRAREDFVHLPDDASPGVFLEMGGRFYIDAGCHPEFATPEVTTPWEAVRYVKAGERFLLQLAGSRRSRRRPHVTRVFRTNVDYASGTTFGCHESFLHRAEPALVARHIIPHLVSRLVFTGAGGFDNRSAGLEFMLSPRVAHLEHERSASSTHARGIFHTKDESLCGAGWHRLHVLCGESLGSELAIFLKLGTTALVVALIDAGLRPGEGVELRAPVAAMDAFARDPTCTARVALRCGRSVTAVEIQRHYLAVAESQRQAPFMPPWAEEVSAHWRLTLDALERGAPAVSTALDWGIKYAVFRERTRRRGVVWESLPAWNRIANRLAEALAAAAAPGSGEELNARIVLAARSPIAAEVGRLTPFVQSQGLSWSGLGAFLALRQELFEVDTRFGQLGDDGIFSALDAAGVLTHRLADVGAVAPAL